MTNANADVPGPHRPSMLADLKLDDIVVESLHLRTEFQAPHPEVGVDDAPIPEVSVDILQAADELRFMIPMTIRLNRQKSDRARFGYSLDLRVLGFFSFLAGTDAHHVAHLIRLNAPAILYGVARGIAAQALALTPAGRVFLPSVNFVEIMKQREKRLRRQRQESPVPD